jgi:hypothetical protein
MKPDTLTDLLALAVPKPAHIANADAAAVLALALHCLMVRDGFTVECEASASGRTPQRRSSYAPPADWNGRFHDEWVFSYSKDGKANSFVLHCSLQVRGRGVGQAAAAAGRCLPVAAVVPAAAANWLAAGHYRLPRTCSSAGCAPAALLMCRCCCPATGRQQAPVRAQQRAGQPGKRAGAGPAGGWRCWRP